MDFGIDEMTAAFTIAPWWTHRLPTRFRVSRKRSGRYTVRLPHGIAPRKIYITLDSSGVSDAHWLSLVDGEVVPFSPDVEHVEVRTMRRARA